jgi:acetyl/propionyl-CoA carboxylase alpha subunit
LTHLKFPEANQYLRVETGILPGDTVGVTYDPMIAKLVTWGRDRGEALRRMKEALEGMEVVGCGTNVEFLKRLCENERFIKGDVETGFIGMQTKELFPQKSTIPDETQVAVAALAVLKSEGALANESDVDPWKAFAGFGLNHDNYYKIPVNWVVGRNAEGKEIEQDGEVEVVFAGKHLFNLTVRTKPKMEGKVVGLPTDVLSIEGIRLLSSKERKSATGTTVEVMLDMPGAKSANPTSRIVQATAVVVPEDGNQKQGGAFVFCEGKFSKLGLPIPDHVKQTHKMEQAGSVLTPMPCKIITVSAAIEILIC